MICFLLIYEAPILTLLVGASGCCLDGGGELCPRLLRIVLEYIKHKVYKIHHTVFIGKEAEGGEKLIG